MIRERSLWCAQKGRTRRLIKGISLQVVGSLIPCLDKRVNRRIKGTRMEDYMDRCQNGIK
jgi:hypothetical protein